MAANKESLFKIGQNIMNNALNKGSSLFNKVDFTNVVPNPTQEQMEANYLNRISNFAQPAISKGSEVLQGLQDFAQQSVQPAQTNVMEQGDLYGPIDQEPQQQGFLRPFVDYAKSPEGTQMLADLARLGVAATRKDPIVAGTMAQSLSQDLAQRPIQAAQRKKAAQDEEMFDLNKLLKLTQIEALGAKQQADANKAKDKKIESYTDFIRDLKAKGITPVSKNENISKVPKQYIQEYETPDGGKSTFINRKGYNEARVSAKQDDARVNKSVQQADTILNTINKFITTKKGPDGKDRIYLNDIGKAVTTGQGVAGLSFLTSLEPAKQRLAKLTEQPNTKAGSRFLDTLKANLGFKELQEMRQNSKTGGALGNVSDTEIKFLQAAQSAIDFNMPAEEFLTLLQEMKSSAMRLKKDLSRIGTVDNILMEADRSLQYVPMTNYEDMPTGGIEIGEGYSIVGEEE